MHMGTMNFSPFSTKQIAQKKKKKQMKYSKFKHEISEQSIEVVVCSPFSKSKSSVNFITRTFLFLVRLRMDVFFPFPNIKEITTYEYQLITQWTNSKFQYHGRLRTATNQRL